MGDARLAGSLVNHVITRSFGSLRRHGSCPYKYAGIAMIRLSFFRCEEKLLRKKEVSMAIQEKLQKLLEAEKVPYEIFTHPLAYTAQEVAASQHIPGNALAKVVMLEVDGTLVMAVTDGNHKIDLDTARANLGTSRVRLTREDEFTARFPGCEPGAMPPFGNLFGLKVIVDPALSRAGFIYFNAGDHVRTMRLRYKDFLALVKPQIVRLSDAPKRKAA